MSFYTLNYKLQKQIDFLMNAISKDLKVDKSIILHFLCIDLERIYNEKIQVHKLHLISFEKEFKELNKKELELKAIIENTKFKIESSENTIVQLSNKLIEKEAHLKNLKNQVAELKLKINELNNVVIGIEKEKKQFDFNFMMKNHSNKEKTQKSNKRLNWLLTSFTIIAIIIAILIIKMKSK